MSIKMVCQKCNDKGSYVVKDGFGMVTLPCDCRLSLPKREGKAAWWSLEHVKTMEFSHPLITVEAVIENELPMSEDNYRLIRTPENAYYPVMVKIERSGEDFALTSDALRQYAKWLNEVADEVDKADLPMPQAEMVE